MDRSIIPESRFGEVSRSVLREFVKNTKSSNPLGADRPGLVLERRDQKKLQVSPWRRKILDRKPLWS
jgi:hypothetical protein